MRARQEYGAAGAEAPFIDIRRELGGRSGELVRADVHIAGKGMQS